MAPLGLLDLIKENLVEFFISVLIRDILFLNLSGELIYEVFETYRYCMRVRFL